MNQRNTGVLCLELVKSVGMTGGTYAMPWGPKRRAFMGTYAIRATLRSKELGGGQLWGEKRRTKLRVKAES